jgi:co-chaperonin GroES (HSP10)
MATQFDVKEMQIRAINEDVIVCDMDFGEMTTASGLVIQSDDAKVHGIKPRWGKVYKIGPQQKDVKVGEWILIEHGRWTRKVKIDDGESIKEIQKVDIKCILMASDEPPEGFYIGTEYANGSTSDIRPDDFITR